MERHTDGRVGKQTDEQIDGKIEADRQMDRQTDRQADGQAVRTTDLSDGKIYRQNILNQTIYSGKD